MSTTSTPESARDHARAQAGTAAEFQRTVPAGRITRAPTAVAPSQMLWEETVAPGNYAIQRLPRGARLRLTDRDGDTCVQLIVYNANQPAERLNVADTVKVQWQAYFGQNQLLLSDLGRVLMSSIEDTAAGHDMFNAMSNNRWNTRKYGSGALYSDQPNARDLFAVALTKVGLSRVDICPAANLFKKVRVAPDGGFTWHGDESVTGSSLTLRCEMDLLVALTVTPHVLDPRTEYRVSPLEIQAWTDSATPADDPIRNATPEGQRAFENTEYYVENNESRD